MNDPEWLMIQQYTQIESYAEWAWEKSMIMEGVVFLRLKAHPYVPNASLSNLNIFRTRTYQDWSRKIRMYGNVASIEGV